MLRARDGGWQSRPLIAHRHDQLAHVVGAAVEPEHIGVLWPDAVGVGTAAAASAAQLSAALAVLPLSLRELERPFAEASAAAAQGSAGGGARASGEEGTVPPPPLPVSWPNWAAPPDEARAAYVRTSRVDPSLGVAAFLELAEARA